MLKLVSEIYTVQRVKISFINRDVAILEKVHRQCLIPY